MNPVVALPALPVNGRIEALEAARPASATQRRAGNSEPHALYAYAIVPLAAAAPSCEGLLSDTYVESVSLGELNVLISQVPSDVFETGGKNPEWIAARAAAHHAVNVSTTDRGPCLPLTFGALFSDVQALRARLAPQGRALLNALQRIGRQSEWTIRLHEDSTIHIAWLENHDEALASMRRSLAAAVEGTAFLLQRSVGKAQADTRTRHLNEVSARIGALFADAGLDTIGRLRQGLPEWSVLASAVDQITLVTACASAGLTESGIALDVSGPWPAYAFARAALRETADA